MLIINGKKFAKNDKEFVSTLFQADGTAIGYYKRTVKGLYLYDHQKKPMVYMEDTPKFTGAVTCHLFEGKKRYMYALCSTHESLLGFDTLSYLQGKDKVREILQSC